MDSEGVRLPPKPAYQNPTALFKSTQLDLTPEKESTMPTRKQLNNNENSNNLSTKILGNTTNEAKKIYACLAQPSINSSNRICRKLAVLQEEKFDAATAIAEELEQSETARTNLGEKVALAVNVKKGSHVYCDLVPLDVDDNDLLAEYECIKTKSMFKTVKSELQEPDIMAFFAEDFETQVPHFDYAEFYIEEPLPRTIPASFSHLFDLYQHHQCWQEL